MTMKCPAQSLKHQMQILKEKFGDGSNPKDKELLEGYRTQITGSLLDNVNPGKCELSKEDIIIMVNTAFAEEFDM